MTTQEKRPMVFLLIDTLTFLIYYFILTRVYEEYARSVGELPFWGAAILILMPLMIASRIILYILYSIINTTITKEKEDKFLVDELGEMIKLKASRNFSKVFMIGFMITMLFLIFGISISVMFQMFYFSILFAFIAQNISAYYYAKKGI